MTVSIRAVPSCAEDFVREAEGCVTFVYDDAHAPARPYVQGEPVLGTLTGGVGHTGNLRAGPVSDDQAATWLRQDLRYAAYVVCQHARGAEAELSDHQYAALISFALDTGGGPDRGPKEWTVWRRLRAGQLDQVPVEMMRFTHRRIGGQMVESPGLVNRRTAERRLWATLDGPAAVPVPVPRPSSPATAAPAPVPVDPDPPSRSKTLIASAATAAASAPVAIKQVSDAMSPYAAHSNTVAQIIGGLALIAALCAGATVAFYAWHKHKARGA